METESNVFYVKNNLDSGLGSLRSAIELANLTPNTNSKIFFDLHENFTINLTSGEILVRSNIKLINKLCNKVKISTNLTSRIFHVPLEPVSTSFVIKGGKGIVLSHAVTDLNGGAIYVEQGNHTLILDNVKITKSSANLSGGAIYTLGRLTLVNSRIVKNTANNLGAGVYSVHTVNMINSSVNRNSILLPENTNGAGGIFVDNGDLLMNNSNVSFNKVASLTGDEPKGGSGGAIIVMNGSVYVQNCSHVDNNSAFNSGGIQEGIGNVVVSNNSTVNNNKSYNNSTGSAGGGGITLTMGFVNITDSEVSNNTTVGMYSAGVVTLVGDVVVTNSKLSNNVNRGPGGAIAVNLGSVQVSKSKITHNTASSIGGAIVNFSPDPKFIIVDNSVISCNKVDNNQTVRQTIEAFLQTLKGLLDSISAQALLSDNFGSLVFLGKVPSILEKISYVNERLQDVSYFYNDNTVVGGAIGTLLTTNLVITNSNISNNFVGKIASDSNIPFTTYGGAVYGFDSNININNSLFLDNVSKDNAGALYNRRTTNISSSRFTNNSAGINGGAIFNDFDGNMTIVESEINCNRSGQNGGGIFNRAALELTKTKILNNTTRVNGGGIYTVSEFTKYLTEIKNNKPNNVFVEVVNN